MSDTPRTREETRWYESGIVHACFAKELERELNAANERIKKLENHIDLLEQCGNSFFYGLTRDNAMERWNKAKEAKP